MQLWPVLLWPKLKARQHTQPYNRKNINVQFITRASSIPTTAPTIATTVLYIFVINALLLITTASGLSVKQQPSDNYEGVNAIANVDMVSALTGLSNGYAPSNYLKNYYQVGEAEATKQQIQQQQWHYQNNENAASVKSRHQEEVGSAGVIGRGFLGSQSNNYGNSIVAREASSGIGGGGGGGLHENNFNVYDSGFVPTTFTAAGQHYAASLAGLQTAPDRSNTLYQFGMTAGNKNNLHAKHQPYVNANSISNNNNNHHNNVAEVNNNKAEYSLFGRLSNQGGLNKGDGDTSGSHFEIENDGRGSDAVDDTTTGEFIQNYELNYADNAQQPSLLQNFYNQQNTFNDAQSLQEQTFTNYFPPLVPATAGYEIENQQNYYRLNNYQQTTEPPQQQFEQQQYLQYQQKQQQPYELQEQTLNKLEIPTASPAPETYYQTFIQHKHDNKEHQHHHYRHVAADNYQTRKQKNQITANYQPNQSAIKKQNNQQQLQQSLPNNQYQQPHLLQEPETAETSHSSRIKKSPKHKSKRHDNYEVYEHSNSYESPLEEIDNTIYHGSEHLSSVQLQQLEKLQEQLQQQQQQFLELQHQLIDHDQQLQIQKHVTHSAIPTLPPITQTVHHNHQSLQAMAGSPLSKHTQIIKTIPVPQHQQVYVPYRENVTIEVPDPVIAAIKEPFAIQIPVTNTVTKSKIHEVKIPIEKVKPFPVERPIPYIVERRVPYAVEKQVAQPVYYPVPIKVPVLHTVIHKIPNPHRHQSSYHLPHTVYHKSHGHGHGHGHGHIHGHSHGHSRYYLK